MKKYNNSNDFLPHLSDVLRLKIASCYAKHEMRKLLSVLHDDKLWDAIDGHIDTWPETLRINNFWNGIHGISIGFRLKSLVPWITSLHVQWRECDVAIDELWFGGRFGPITALNSEESALDVKEKIFLPENKNILEQEQAKNTLIEKSSATAPRDHFPIFAVRKENKLRVIDGNRRLLRAIVEVKRHIRTFVGEPIVEPILYEHWVPTQLLVDLVFWCEENAKSGRDIIEITARIITELIKDSSAGRKEFMERAIHSDNEIHMRLQKAVEKI